MKQGLGSLRGDGVEGSSRARDSAWGASPTTNFCGQGGWKDDDRPGQNTGNNSGPSYGATDNNCGNDVKAARTAAHERTHNLARFRAPPRPRHRTGAASTSTTSCATTLGTDIPRCDDLRRRVGELKADLDAERERLSEELHSYPSQKAATVRQMQRADDEWAEARLKHARMGSADGEPAPPLRYLHDRGKVTLEAVGDRVAKRHHGAATAGPARLDRIDPLPGVTERTNAPELRSPLPGRGE
jgi:hypothetical protein